MILGRWSLAAFVRYIRPQVMEWTAGMSMLMLRSTDFRHADPTTASFPPNADVQPTPTDLESLQANLDTVINNPEELQFSGSTLESAGSSPLNLGF
ncbi:hypothetical protein ACA910_018073 [Epithemia clementina (nom. ined.)]